MAKHLSHRASWATWLEAGAVVVLLVLVGGVSMAGPGLWRTEPQAVVTQPPVSSTAPTPAASPAAAQRVVAPPTLQPEPTPRPEPRSRPEPSPASEPRSEPDRVPTEQEQEGLQDLREAAEAELAPPLTFRMASFNVLGSSHTARGGNKPGFAPGPTRMTWAADLLRNSGVEVVGFQEYEPNQHHAFVRRTGGSWGVFPGMSMGTKGVRNSVAWNTAAWRLVEAHTTPIPYFRGKPVPMPYVLLENLETGQRAWFISIHNPTSNPRRGNNQHWRNVATQRERDLLVDLHASGNPVFLTGDFNERNEAFCKVTSGGVAQAANGGSSGPPCQVPGNMGIDWIFGTPEVMFSDYLRRQDSNVRRISDHPLILSTATLPGE